jgi:hypothetical protein
MGGSDKASNDQRQTAAFLKPFRDRSIAELAALLQRIDDFQKTGRCPEPPAKTSRRPAAAKSPKRTVDAAAKKVVVLLERITDPELEYAAIDAELRVLDALTRPDLLKVAQEVGMTIGKSLSKPAILEELRRRVRDRKGAYKRTRFRPDPALDFQYPT